MYKYKDLNVKILSVTQGSNKSLELIPHAL